MFIYILRDLMVLKAYHYKIELFDSTVQADHLMMWMLDPDGPTSLS